MAQITVKFHDIPLVQAIKEIENISDYNFFYSNSLKGLDSKVSADLKGQTIEKVMETVLNGLEIGYEIKPEKQIILFHKETGGIESKEMRTNRMISGHVKDAKGQPIIGASVFIADKKVGTTTDTDGKYELEASPSDVISVYFIGYKKASMSIDGKAVIDFTLKDDTELLNEAVVVGYGVQKKINLTGSVSMINAGEMEARPISSVSNGLQGLLPGVTVVNPSGQPGSSLTTIRIRGIGTIGNNNPLILIDGVEGDMSSLNPEDIESISVLKDAASSAIYGARAANGVLLITTRNIGNGKQSTRITFNSYYGFQMPVRLPEMCGAVDYMTLDNEARTNVGAPIAWTEEQFDKVEKLSDPNYFGNTDWVNSVLDTYAPQQNYYVGIQSHVGNSGYLLSYRYLDQDGLTVGNSTGERRNNLRFKMDSKVLDIVTLNSNISYTSRHIWAPVGALTSQGGAIYQAMRIAPNVPIRYTDGTWAYGGGNTNPVAILNDGGRTTTDYGELSIQETMKVDITKGWNVSATYNFSNADGLANALRKTIEFANPDDNSSYKYNYPNSLKVTDVVKKQETLILQSNFDFDIGEHNISGVVGFSQESYKYKTFSASRENLITEDNPALNLGDATTMSNDASTSQWALRSGFGRVSYNYAGRYLFETDLRYDLSSHFQKEHRGGLFPSFSAGWRASEEDFMDFMKPMVDNLKLRVSWGMLGNQYVGSSDYPYLSVLTSETSGISLIGTNPTTGYTQTTLANPELSWEKVKMFNVGVDLNMFNDRLSASFDWYDKDTDGILLQLNYPAQIGAVPSEENAGSVNNKGWELNVGWKDNIGALGYSLTFNLADVKNKITDLGDTEPDLSGYQIRMVGYPIDAFYGYVAEGLMMPEDFGYYDESEKKYMNPNVPVVVGNDYQPGDIKYKDISGPEGKPDGRITPEYDRVVLGSNIPRYTYSFVGNLTYRNWDLGFTIQGVGKCDGYLKGSARNCFQDMAAYPQIVHLKRFNLESNPDPDASYPRLTYNVGYNQNTFSTYWLEDASYLRVKNLQIGYSLPEGILKKCRIDKSRIYVSADNLFTFTKFFYAYDPETPVSSGGYYPQVKTVVLGINITFK
ncbi:MAG: TonB-dependent receptor [Bacteroidales bacterium]|nr:TonB-dependent receptor [Bacteroidales bacterium]MCI2145874.1 TonB-dependent receptor [Bacteroidales bacterium]